MAPTKEKFDESWNNGFPIRVGIGANQAGGENRPAHSAEEVKTRYACYASSVGGVASFDRGLIRYSTPRSWIEF